MSLRCVKKQESSSVRCDLARFRGSRKTIASASLLKARNTVMDALIFGYLSNNNTCHRFSRSTEVSLDLSPVYRITVSQGGELKPVNVSHLLSKPRIREIVRAEQVGIVDVKATVNSIRTYPWRNTASLIVWLGRPGSNGSRGVVSWEDVSSARKSSAFKQQCVPWLGRLPPQI